MTKFQLLVHMNGFRLFASEGIFVYADSGGNGNELRFFDNGNNGGNGGQAPNQRSGGGGGGSSGGDRECRGGGGGCSEVSSDVSVEN